LTKPHFLRRDVLGLFTSIAALLGPGRRLVFGKPGDHGIGGTGAVPTEKPEEDRGIGGTGVIGTIRRFGSIVVNGLRISYPKDVIVLRDGEPSDVRALRLGHVVRVVAEKHQGSFSTRTINVTSEVIGTVEQTEAGRLTVAGQTVVTTGLKHARWAEGDRIAVSGLRRANGDIVASLIEPSTREMTRVSGPVQEALDGSLHIANVRLEGVDRSLAGQRAIVEGSYDQGRLQASAFAAEQALLGPNVRRLSIEAYVQRDANRLVLGSGFDVVASPASITRADHPARAILTGEISPGGQLTIERIHVLSRSDIHGEALPQGHGGGRGPGDFTPGGGNGPRMGGGSRNGGMPAGSPAAGQGGPGQGGPGFGNQPPGGIPNNNGGPASNGLGNPAGAPGMGNPGFGGPGIGNPNIGNPGVGGGSGAPGFGGPGRGFGPAGGPGPGRR